MLKTQIRDTRPLLCVKIYLESVLYNWEEKRKSMGKMTGKQTIHILFFFFAGDQVIIAKDKDYAEYIKIIIPRMGLKCNYSQNSVFICSK